MLFFIFGTCFTGAFYYVAYKCHKAEQKRLQAKEAPKQLHGHPYREGSSALVNVEQEVSVASLPPPSLNERMMNLFPLCEGYKDGVHSVWMYLEPEGVSLHTKVKGIDVKATGKDVEEAFNKLESQIVATLEKQAQLINGNLETIRGQLNGLGKSVK